MIKIFLEGKYLDLFNDENIELSESVQNIQDITKVFTAYTQSFTVPATPTNNAVFKHWYNPEIINGFNGQERVSGFIELNDSTFKVGTFLLEKAVTKKGVVNSYTMSFTGKVFDLKNTLLDSTLADLDYTSLIFGYNATNVINIMQSTTLNDVYFPLISSKNFWTYGGGGVTDISVNGNLHWYELFPSLSLNWILKAMISQFDLPIDITKGDIVDNALLQGSHALFKNQELTAAGTIKMPTLTNKAVFTTGTTFINATDDTIQFPVVDSNNYTSWISGYVSSNQYQFINSKYRRIQVTFTTLTGDAVVYLYRNGVEFKVQTAVNTSTIVFWVNDAETYEIYYKTMSPQSVVMQVDCTLGVKYLVKTPLDFTFVQTTDYTNEIRPSLGTTTSDINFNAIAPKVKLIDIFKGILTMFNGTLSLDGDLITMQSLERWYLVGDKLDLTPYIDTSSIEIIRPKLPRTVNFKNEDSKSVSNTAYTDLTGQKYGDLSATFSYDGGDVTYQLPWETPLPVEIANDVMVMFLIDKDSKPYTPKLAVLTYDASVTSPNIHVDNGAGHTVLSDYFPVSTTFNDGTFDRSINWGEELDQRTKNGIENSLYQLGYSNYIANLYNPQSRLVACKGNLPKTILNKLSLNDRILVKDKMYIINDYKVDLNKGNTSLNLLTDYREPIQQVVYLIDSDEQTVSHTQDTEVPETFETSASWYGNSAMGVNYTQQTSNPIDVLIPANTTPNTRKGYYFIYFYLGTMMLNRIVRVTIIQTGSVAPSNALITTDGEYITTTDGQFIVTT